MEATRRAEIEEEERVREGRRDRKQLEGLAFLVLIAAPAIALIMGSTSWPYWLWLGAGLLVALVWFGREDRVE